MCKNTNITMKERTHSLQENFSLSWRSHMLGPDAKAHLAILGILPGQIHCSDSRIQIGYIGKVAIGLMLNIGYAWILLRVVSKR